MFSSLCIVGNECAQMFLHSNMVVMVIHGRYFSAYRDEVELTIVHPK